ncbi:GMP synthase domain protein [Halomonas sp. KO116]|nr:GMP synthase domain protein [Halomonas sp. KO116]
MEPVDRDLGLGKVLGHAAEEGWRLRAVETIDFMTARWAHLPYELLEKVFNRLSMSWRGSRMIYDVSRFVHDNEVNTGKGLRLLPRIEHWIRGDVVSEFGKKAS